MSQEGEYEDWVTFTRCCFTAFHQGFCFLIKLTILPFQKAKLSAFSVSKRASTSEWSEGMEKMASFLQKCRREHEGVAVCREMIWAWCYSASAQVIGCRKSSTRTLCPAPGPCVGKWGSSTEASNIAQIYTPSTHFSTLVIRKTPQSSIQKLWAMKPVPFVQSIVMQDWGGSGIDLYLLKWRHRGYAA